jgi:hypothetical protein
MSPSHALPHRAPQPRSYLGIGLVLALHLAGIYALSAGLLHPEAKLRSNIVLRPLPPEAPPELPRPEPLRADQPQLRDLPVIQAQPPVIDFVAPQESAAPAAVVAPTEGIPAPARAMPAQGLAPTQPAVAGPQVQAPGAVCSVMPRPEVPAVNWSGEAVLQAIATVRGGRVVGADVRVTQGAPDGKTRRALQRSVESALAGYACQGDAMFQQDFAFRVD